jgi:hypothetical protein
LAAPATGLPHTAAEIAGRLEISMAVFQKERLRARHVAAIRELGTQRIELLMAPTTFDFQDRQQVKEILIECQKTDVSVVSVHGNLQRKYNDPVEEKRRTAAAALLDEIRFAEEAAARDPGGPFRYGRPSPKNRRGTAGSDERSAYPVDGRKHARRIEALRRLRGPNRLRPVRLDGRHRVLQDGTKRIPHLPGGSTKLRLSAIGNRVCEVDAWSPLASA